MLICIKSVKGEYFLSLLDFNPVHMKVTEYPPVSFPYLTRHVDFNALASSVVDVSYGTNSSYYTYRLDSRNEQTLLLLSAYEAIYEEIHDSKFYVDYPEILQLLECVFDIETFVLRD